MQSDEGEERAANSPILCLPIATPEWAAAGGVLCTTTPWTRALVKSSALCKGIGCPLGTQALPLIWRLHIVEGGC